VIERCECGARLKRSGVVRIPGGKIREYRTCLSCGYHAKVISLAPVELERVVLRPRNLFSTKSSVEGGSKADVA
jgi:hypothetical protein